MIGLVQDVEEFATVVSACKSYVFGKLINSQLEISVFQLYHLVCSFDQNGKF